MNGKVVEVPPGAGQADGAPAEGARGADLDLPGDGRGRDGADVARGDRGWEAACLPPPSSWPDNDFLVIGIKRGRLMASDWRDRHGDKQTSTWRERDVQYRGYFRTLAGAELAAGVLRDDGFDRVEIMRP